MPWFNLFFLETQAAQKGVSTLAHTEPGNSAQPKSCSLRASGAIIMSD